MAKKAYVGVGGSSRNVKAIYVGVNGEPKKVIKGYVGVNGVPCLFWDDSIPPIPSVPDSWDYWTTVKGKTLLNFYYEQQDVPIHAMIQKKNTTTTDGILFYGYFYLKNAYYEEGYYVISISNRNKVYSYNVTAIPSNAFVDGYRELYQGMTWGYYVTDGRLRYGQGHAYPVGAYETETYLGEFTKVAEAAENLADRIIATPFQEDYQTGINYNLTTTDIRKTVRKALSTSLLVSAPDQSLFLSMPAYAAFLDNVDAFVDTLVSKTNGSEIIMLDVMTLQDGVTIDFYYGAGISGVDNAHVTNVVTKYNRTYFVFMDADGNDYVYPNNRYRIDIDEEGNITETYLEPDQDIQFWAGMWLERYSTVNTRLIMTNLGIDL